MSIITQSVHLETQGNTDIIDITDKVRSILIKNDVGSGIINIFVPGATGALTTIEYESGLIDDFKQLIDTLIPRKYDYAHNERWHDGNGHSHIRASVIGPSLTVPFVQKKLLLGTWQQIIFIDFDNCSRSREIILQIVGE